MSTRHTSVNPQHAVRYDQIKTDTANAKWQAWFRQQIDAIMKYRRAEHFVRGKQQGFDMTKQLHRRAP